MMLDTVRVAETATRGVAYCGDPVAPGALWASWNVDPWLIAALAGSAIGVAMTGGDAVRRHWLGLALAVLTVAFVSPLCALSSSLFAARTVHHVLIVAVAAPALAAALPRRAQGGMAGVALGLSTAILWGWHLPAAYTAALDHPAVYWAMQVSLLASATWFWHALFARGASPATALVAVAAAVGQMGLLGAILTFAPRPLYAHHLIAPYEWGLTPLQDQQLAGLIMWAPAMIPYFAIGVAIARRAFARSGQERPA
ncbi:cytochrome c oxidase assembly protein [Sphingomonas sp.]